MELWAFLGIAFVAVVFFIWRSRRGTTNDVDSLTKGLPDDLRDKNGGMISLPNGGQPPGNVGGGGSGS